MKMSEMFPSRYLTKEDVESPKVLTIESVELADVGGGVTKPVIYFSEDDSKAWALNKTTGKLLESLFGDDTEGWIGNQIELYIDPDVKLGNEKVGGIRCRKPGVSRRSVSRKDESSDLWKLPSQKKAVGEKSIEGRVPF